VEIIELLSDDDTPPPGDASNPIVLDSDEEADEQGSSVQPLREASQSSLRRKNIPPETPSGSNHLALSHASQSSSPDASNTGEEFHDAESPSAQRASLSHQHEHPVQAVDQLSVVNAKADQMPLPIQDSPEIQDKMSPNGVSENTRDALSPVASSPSPMSPKSKNKGILSHPHLATGRIFSSPNRSHDPSADASADSSVVPVRGTLYSGRCGLWKGFFKATAAEPTSPSRPSRNVEEQRDTRSKEAPAPPRANPPCNSTSTTLVSLARNMSIRSSPTPSSVDGKGLENSDGPTITTLDNNSSAPIGEPSR